MNFRAPLVWCGLMVTLACDPPAVAPETAPDAGALDLTDNGSQDAGAGVSEDAGEGAPSGSPDAGELDGGWLDAGPSDAGIACPPLTHWTADGCLSDVTVRLTGTALAIRGSTLIAGTGQQPVLEVFVDSPPALGSPAVTIEIAPSDSDAGTGGDQVHEIAEATSDDAGTHYDYAWNTIAAGEGLYTARAEVGLGDAGFQSNPVHVLVDRTPPAIQLKVDFDVDAGVQPRDFGASILMVAHDDGGSGDVGIGLAADGVVWTKQTAELALRQTVRVDLPVDLPAIEGSTTTLRARVNGADVPFDAWSTAADGWKIALRVTATDLAGNTSAVVTDVPVTRQLWQNGVASSGPVSLGAQGQILVNHGVSLDALFPDGTLQSRTNLNAQSGGQLDALGRPATLVSKVTPDGETYVASSTRGHYIPYSQISAVSHYGSQFQTFVPENALLASFALSASRESLYALPQDCGIVAIDALSGEAGTTSSKDFASTCAGGLLAVGANDLIASSPTNSIISALPSLAEDWAQPEGIAFPGFPPLFLGDRAVFESGGALTVYDPSQGGFWAAVVDLVAPFPAHAVSSSSGELFFLATNGILSKTDGSGTQLWTRQLKIGSATTGLVLGSNAGAGGDLVYAVDASGRIWAYDASGAFHWSSPANMAEGDLLIDRCTGHAYASVGGTPTAVVLDSLGVDASPGSWPMGGHDVFQTYDSESTADVDCSAHL